MDLKNNQESFVSADSICCLTKDINFEFPIDFCRTLNSSNLILNPILQNTKILNFGEFLIKIQWYFQFMFKLNIKGYNFNDNLK